MQILTLQIIQTRFQVNWYVKVKSRFDWLRPFLGDHYMSDSSFQLLFHHLQKHTAYIKQTHHNKLIGNTLLWLPKENILKVD
jgi:hypothetical protein